MNKYGIRPGEEIAVLVYRDQEFLGACLIEATLADQVAIRLHYYDDELLVTFIEAFTASLGAAKFEVDKPRLRGMVAQRVRELNALSEDRTEGDPPALSTSDIQEIPF